MNLIINDREESDSWIKTPGLCIIKDGFENMGELLSKCSRLSKKDLIKRLEQ